MQCFPSETFPAHLLFQNLFRDCSTYCSTRSFHPVFSSCHEVLWRRVCDRWTWFSFCGAVWFGLSFHCLFFCSVQSFNLIFTSDAVFFPSSYLPWILGFPFVYFSQVCECGACSSLVCSSGNSTCQPLCHWMFLFSSLSLYLYTYKALFWDAIRHQENTFLYALLGRDEQLWVLTPH